MQDKLPEFMMSVVLAVLAPLITASVAALTFVVRDWRLRRNANGRKDASDRAGDEAGCVHRRLVERLRQVAWLEAGRGSCGSGYA